MVKSLNGKQAANLLFTLGGVLLICHFLWEDTLQSSVPGYDLARTLLMVIIVGCLLFVKPAIGFWVTVLFVILLLRFFLDDYLAARVSWYGVGSFLLTGLVLLITVVTEIGAIVKKNEG